MRAIMAFIFLPLFRLGYQRRRAVLCSVLVVHDKTRLLQKPECRVARFVRLDFVDLLAALYVKIEGEERKVVDGGIEGRKFLGNPLLPERLGSQLLPDYLL